jgi:hypothetical protein
MSEQRAKRYPHTQTPPNNVRERITSNEEDPDGRQEMIYLDRRLRHVRIDLMRKGHDRDEVDAVLEEWRRWKYESLYGPRQMEETQMEDLSERITQEMTAKLTKAADQYWQIHEIPGSATDDDPIPEHITQRLTDPDEDPSGIWEMASFDRPLQRTRARLLEEGWDRDEIDYRLERLRQDRMIVLYGSSEQIQELRKIYERANSSD